MVRDLVSKAKNLLRGFGEAIFSIYLSLCMNEEAKKKLNFLI